MWTITKRQQKCSYQSDETDPQSKSQRHRMILKKAVHWADTATVSKCVPDISVLNRQSRQWQIWGECKNVTSASHIWWWVYNPDRKATRKQQTQKILKIKWANVHTYNSIHSWMHVCLRNRSHDQNLNNIFPNHSVLKLDSNNLRNLYKFPQVCGNK